MWGARSLGTNLYGCLQQLVFMSKVTSVMDLMYAMAVTHWRRGLGSTGGLGHPDGKKDKRAPTSVSLTPFIVLISFHSVHVLSFLFMIGNSFGETACGGRGVWGHAHWWVVVQSISCLL